MSLARHGKVWWAWNYCSYTHSYIERYTEVRVWVWRTGCFTPTAKSPCTSGPVWKIWRGEGIFAPSGYQTTTTPFLARTSFAVPTELSEIPYILHCHAYVNYFHELNFGSEIEWKNFTCVSCMSWILSAVSVYTKSLRCFNRFSACALKWRRNQRGLSKGRCMPGREEFSQL